MPVPAADGRPPPVAAAGQPLDSAWIFALSPADAWASPAEADRYGTWREAVVPGTAAAALERLGLWDRDAPAPLHDQDIWYRTDVDGTGSARLRFEGLATIAEIWLESSRVATSDSMFVPVEVPVELHGRHQLTLVFRSLKAALERRTGPRARWRTRMVEDARLRFVRTTVLGHAPGWCPPIHVVGPYRPVLLVRDGPDWRLRSRVDGRDGLVMVEATLPDMDAEPQLVCGEHRCALTRNADGRWHGTLRIPDAQLWWPHTHGEPRLYSLRLQTKTQSYDLGRTGFRTVALDRGADGRGFTLLVNGTRVFCRGVCWTPDLVRLGGDRADYEPALRQLKAAHLNMLRVGGTMLYESPAFHALCDELGILVWQDAMLANFDYPRDDDFVRTVETEVRTHLRRLQGSPSLAVLCGGSEVQQQAAMMGLPPAGYTHPLFDTVLPAVLEDERPDAVYVPGSPSGGTLPFTADGGPTHYYGVGAYNLPLEDARRATVRFASECLTFANVPEDATLRRHGLDPSGDPDRWQSLVPRDNGAAWTFEDTRHHYMARLYGIDPAALLLADPQRYRDLSRAVTAEVTERTFDEWRRPGSPAAGGLVWFARDFVAGPGWGVIDSTGRPKSNYHGLRRAAAPLRLSITDEGVNGLALHCVNDGAEPVAGTLRIDCLRGGTTRVMRGEAGVAVPPRGGLTRSAFELFGSFFDAGHVYRFGAAAHDTVHASLADGDDVLAEADWLLDHARNARHHQLPDVAVAQREDGWVLLLSASRALHHVVIDDDALVPDDNWFFLVPGRTKVVKLTALSDAQRSAPPAGQVRALNLEGIVRYG